MNRLDNVSLMTPEIQNGIIQDGNIYNTMIDTNSVAISDFGIITINETTSINIGGSVYSGKDLKEILDLKDKLSQIYPELFI